MRQHEPFLFLNPQMINMSKSTTFPFTQLQSYSEFCASGRKNNIQHYIISLLEKSSQGYTRREISTISGIEINSLTAPLKHLVDQGILTTEHTVKDSKTSRYVFLYELKRLVA